MNIHHYYSILSLLTKFEPTTEKEKKKRKERIGRFHFSARSVQKYPKFKRYPWRVYKSCLCYEIIHATNLSRGMQPIQFRDTTTINYEGGD